METIPVNPQGFSPQPVGIPQKRKSGCGCCGCFTGCLAILLIGFGLVVAALFLVDVDKITDRALSYSYYAWVRPGLIKSFSPKMSADEREYTLTLADAYHDNYLKLSSEEKKRLRKEALVFFYYRVRDQKVPPEKIQGLRQFFIKAFEDMVEKHPEWANPPKDVLPGLEDPPQVLPPPKPKASPRRTRSLMY